MVVGGDDSYPLQSQLSHSNFHFSKGLKANLQPDDDSVFMTSHCFITLLHIICMYVVYVITIFFVYLLSIEVNIYAELKLFFKHFITMTILAVQTLMIQLVCYANKRKCSTYV